MATTRDKSKKNGRKWAEITGECPLESGGNICDGCPEDCPLEADNEK